MKAVDGFGTPGIVSRGNLRGGKLSELRSPHISPSRSPFLGTQLLGVVGMCVGAGEAMDTMVLEVKI